MPTFLAARELCCQLFSEPGAGSDLADLSCRAVRDGDEWVINGQKVWSSGALFAEWGELIARSDVDVPKHKGMTAFIIPMDLPGIEVRPIKQMSGGASFNEVFFTDVRVPDSMRLGGVGDGLAGRPDHARLRARPLRRLRQRPGRRWLAAPRRHRPGDGRHRPTPSCASSWRSPTRTSGSSPSSAGAPPTWRASGTPGPEGSLGKLLWTNGMQLVSDVVSQHPRRRAHRRHRRVGHVRLGRARARRAGLPHRRRLRRGAAQHHRRAGARAPARAAGRQGRAVQGRAALSDIGGPRAQEGAHEG